MAKQIIILDTQSVDGGGTQVNAAFWYTVAVGAEIPVTNAVSKLRTATTAEIAELQAGRVVEEFFSHRAPAGATATQVKAQLIAVYNNRKAIFDGRPNPNQFFGTSWDGTAWT